MAPKILRIILFVLAPFTLIAQAGTPNNRFTSIGQAASVTTANVYYFNLNGTLFSTYVNASGELLVATSFGNAGSGSIPTTPSMDITQTGILGPGTLGLLDGITHVRITSDGNIRVDLTSTNAEIIRRLKANETLNRGQSDNDNGLNATWQGPGGSMMASGCETAGTDIVLSDKVVHPCGNIQGVSWTPIDGGYYETYTNLGQLSPTASFCLWVKGTSGANAPAPVITGLSVSAGTVNAQFSSQVTATNAAAYAVSSGTLPPGLSLNGSTGQITGTPTTAGTYSFSITATNSSSVTSPPFNMSIAITSASQAGIATWSDNGAGGIYPSAWGSVGIGTSSPQEALDVHGNGNFTGNIKMGNPITWPAQLATTLVLKSMNDIPNISNTYSYPFEIQQTAGVTNRFQIASYRRKANGTDWGGSAYRLQFAADNSFTNGEKAFVEIGASDPANIYGGFISLATEGQDRLIVNSAGNVMIGKTTQLNAAYKLDVAGWARADKLVVNATGADFVFDPSYRLKPLSELENYVGKNRHLPGMAPAAEMQKCGVEVGESQTKLLQKIEELTLYIIQQNKAIEAQNKRIGKLEARPTAKNKSGKRK